jgi:polyvinyl alcohol dehydrogenase (cytochrome)
VPDSVKACVTRDPAADCTPPDNYFDASLALDLKSGRIRWAKRVGTTVALKLDDAWTVACFISSLT